MTTKDKILNWIAWKLPCKIVYFAAIRLMAHATMGKYSNTIVPNISGMDAIKRWEDDKLKHKGGE